MTLTEVVTGTDAVLAQVQDGVGVLTLNRPDRRNALNLEMVGAIGAVLAGFEESPEVGAVVLTGAGRAFCGGGDVKSFAARGGAGEGDPPDVMEQRQLRMQHETVGRLHGFAKPTIAALPGAVAGAGLGLALACDLRVGSPATFLVAGFQGVGLPGDYGVAWLLTRLLGPAGARRVLLLGERLDHVIAQEWGLLDRVTEEGAETATARDLAAALAAGPRQAIASTKANLLDAETLDLGPAMDREVPRHLAAGRSDEHREFLRRYTEKRSQPR